MNKEQIMVGEFMSKFGQDVYLKPPQKGVAQGILAFRARLISEEVLKELIPALLSGDLQGIKDGIADSLVVIYGTACALGIDAEECFRLAHEANMAKVWTKEELHVRPLNSIYYPTSTGDGNYIVTNNEGKVLKPPSFKHPIHA
jgi:NTP pyrophosphatase (non-canonical NTP hydrolase)